jgi:hypothetical protein
MLLPIILAGFFATILILLLTWVVVNLDCDLTLYFAEKLGKNPGKFFTEITKKNIF